MACRRLLTLTYCFCLLLVSSTNARQEDTQHVFSQPLRPTLRRFLVNDSHSTEQVVQLATAHDLDIWQIRPSSHVDIYAPSFPPSLLSQNAHTELPLPDLQQEKRVNSGDWNLETLTNTTFHDTYHPLHEIEEFINTLAELHPDLVTVNRLGHSGMGREMVGITVSSTSVEVLGGKKDKKHKKKKKEEGGDVKPKIGFVITGTQHAREWVASATALYLAHALVVNSSEHHSLTHLLDDFDFHIVPVPNPDGYDYTWASDRFWYKNRMALGPKLRCVGIDMNRNWGYKWKPQASNLLRKPPSAPDPCSQFFPGHRPFEAPEVNNIANYVNTLPNVASFIDLRSFGQMISAPYSFNCKRLAKDAENQIEAAMGAAQAAKLVHGAEFSTGTLCSMLYRAPGNIVDWMYARAGIVYSYAVHLRDTGTYGFALPPSFIRPVGEETSALVAYLARFILKTRKV